MYKDKREILFLQILRYRVRIIKMNDEKLDTTGVSRWSVKVARNNFFADARTSHGTESIEDVSSKKVNEESAADKTGDDDTSTGSWEKVKDVRSVDDYQSVADVELVRKIVARQYSDITKIDDFMEKCLPDSLKRVNSVQKPPRQGLETTNVPNEVHPDENVPLLPGSPPPKNNAAFEYAKRNVINEN